MVACYNPAPGGLQFDLRLSDIVTWVFYGAVFSIIINSILLVPAGKGALHVKEACRQVANNPKEIL